MADRWSGPVGRLNAETSDGRIVSDEGFTVRGLPLPMDWQKYTDEGHDKAVTVATIDRVEVLGDGTVWATGEWLDSGTIPEVSGARSLVDSGVVYPSMQSAGCMIEWRALGGGEGDYVDGMYEEGAPYREVCVYTDFEFSKVTLVAVQAFPDLRIGEGDSVGLTAAGVRRSGWDTVPVADNDPKWDGPGAAKRVAAWAGIDQADAPASAWDKYARAFLWQDPDADPETVGAYKLGVADIVDGELRLIPRGVYAVAGVLNGARGGADIPAADQDALKKVVSGLYGRIAKAMGDDTIEAPFALVASVVAPEVPPAAWFADPQLTELTPLTITDDGRVFGHAADWEQIHVGIPGQKPPRSRTGYANFMVGATLTDEGVYATGNLTVGGGHADERLGYAAAAEHYDDAGTAVATVTAGEDQFGIWVAGAIIPEATPGQIRALRRSPLSGDWRYIGGNLEAIAFHAVNTPGFPVVRARSLVADGHVYSLVACAAPSRRPSREKYLAELAEELRPLLASTDPEPKIPSPRPPSEPAFAQVPVGADLRAEFEAAGVAWPTISVTVGGVDLPPYEVAESCVRGMLANAFAVEPAPEDGPVEADKAMASARARLRLFEQEGAVVD